MTLGFVLIATFISVVGVFASTFPDEKPRTALRASIIVVSLTVWLWGPWLWRAVDANYCAAFPVVSEAKP